jgi:hypothetical protein
MVKHLLLAMVLATVLSCGQDTPFAEYEPKTKDELALKNVLLNFEVGVNEKDIKKVADLIHENAALAVGRDRTNLSKAKYVEILPQRLAENPPIALGSAKMNVTGDNAEVKIYMSRGESRYLVTFHMQLANDTWFIKSWDY